ncbi:hypothetical protein ACEWY4_021995 [Coilia grayii]|uniref:Prospero domain-containing protein n=1 Tax=Coilia grayii TaxID=363190 RepID=A0ABD1J4R1_9TELE
MRDQGAEPNSSRLSKRRRVDIGVKRTAHSATGPAFTSDLIFGSPAHHHAFRAAALLGALDAMSHAADLDPDPLDRPPASLTGPLVADGNGSISSSEAKSNVLRKLLKRQANANSSYEDTMTPLAGATIISQLLQSSAAKNHAPTTPTRTPGSGHSPHTTGHTHHSTGPAQPSFPSSTSDGGLQEDACSDPTSSRSHSPPALARLSPPFGHLSPSLAPLPEARLTDEHLRAKRARVENIIRGMSHSPNMAPPPHNSSSVRGGEGEAEVEGGSAEGGGSSSPLGREREILLRENKRKQRLPQQQQQSFRQLVSARAQQRHLERRQLKHQLDDMQKQLRQLQEKFFQVYDSTDSEGQEPSDDPCLPSDDPGGPSDDLSEDSGRSDDAGLDNAHPHRRHRRCPPQRPDPSPSSDACELDPAHFLQRARALLRQRDLFERAQTKQESTPTPHRAKGHASLHAEGKRLAETLKAELNSAMGEVVDSVVKVFAKPALGGRGSHRGGPYPPLQGPLDRFDPPGLHAAPPRPPLQCFGEVIIPSPLESFGGVPLPSANDQTEALPLVVRKTPAEHPQPSALGGATGGLHHPPQLHPSSLSAGVAFAPPAAFRPPFPLPLMTYPFQGALGGAAAVGGYPGKERGGSPDSMELSRDTSSSISLRTKMAAGLHHLGQSQRAVSPSQSGSSADGLSLSLIKAECADLHDMADISPYASSTIQEGLSPNHLKKAKLMFFYTRYPSSNMLKIFFSDVKFNRCITSQLIKWFSNFREFYYIQMEKFARQSINEGVTSNDDITVSRDSELFRALNMHYNKANDFEVPERFLEVAEITLREFFTAIVGGRDTDPSWKKAIYKVICKLDAEVPDVFKSPHCLQELLHD